MKLNLQDIQRKEEWTGKGYVLPSFDIEKMKKASRETPTWVHFGAGNIFRAFIAVLQQRLLNEGKVETGIIVCETFDEEIVHKAYRAFDNLAVAVTLKGNGDIQKEVIASLSESLVPSEDYARMEEVLCAPSLQILSLTITEKGYALKDDKGLYFPWIKPDIENFDRQPVSTIGIITRLLLSRYKTGAFPLALVSMDNCSHNGTLLKKAVLEYAEIWRAQGHLDQGFLDYLTDENKISFTWSMIDKITPRPSEIVQKQFVEDGLEGMDIIITSKKTYVSPFVNAEESQYLAIEDHFPNGKPALEETGVLFSDKETIDKIEKMKVCTCLNPLHTVLAVFGCLLGYDSISAEMKDPLLKGFIEKLGYGEGMPVVVDPGIMNAEDFIRDSIEVRFPNPFVPDTPQRIATDTSKKISVRFGETMKAYIEQGKTDLSFLTYIPLFMAGWLRYLMAVDDKGQAFDLSPDPNLDMVQPFVKSFSLGYSGGVHEELKDLLSNAGIFGIDLYQYHLGEKVEAFFLEMLEGPGAIGKTLAKYIL
ncbi:mannitol dehydrogenase family protein [Oceanispirochaeta sp.]|jgi:fructuronate reductase|uniref:mannitol dehydrogenase family protein n=1 Tax=Oceanispirochaeta sp. TaxID=2035350 RepID=UPI00263430B2|nr:mannitol dehydrogenase family protein [Oceanispirochaeta sp.]MDA3958399.1 mannitol dehydrogenase family protein [Oceanispirochaeta sp.]